VLLRTAVPEFLPRMLDTRPADARNTVVAFPARSARKI
jgi:hypothetical protein